MRILGVSAFYHDSAAALIEDGRVVAAAQEERFTRKKQDSEFPELAVTYCLEEAGIGLDDVDFVAFYDKPFLKFERLLETYVAYAPRGFRSFSMAIPVWLKEKLFQKDLLRKRFAKFAPDFDWKNKLLFAEHHQSHAASAFYPSPFEDAAILTMDGVGEWATTSLGMGHGADITMTREIHFPHSLGLLYSAFTYYTGFKVNSGEYKVMGLAPYGEPRFAQTILDNIIDLKDDGSFRLEQSYFDYCTGLRMTNEKFDALFGAPARSAETLLTQREMDLAASIQAVTEEVVLRLTRSIARDTGAKNFCLAGGVALNCVANGKILQDNSFDNIWVQPAAGDAGGALGAALCAYYRFQNQPRKLNGKMDGMQGSYLGPGYDQNEIERRLTDAGARFQTLSDDETIAMTADALVDEKAVGWFQGRMEFGPRALGGRSILGDPRSPTMQKTLNLRVKYRESFRPFAPSVLREDVADWFELNEDSPYMLMVSGVREDKRREMTDTEKALFGIDKLNVPRSELPAVTHVDYSARIQTVHAETNPRYPCTDQSVQGSHRLPGGGQYQLQRARRTNRVHAGGRLPLLHGTGHRGPCRRQLLLEQGRSGPRPQNRLQGQFRTRLTKSCLTVTGGIEPTIIATMISFIQHPFHPRPLCKNYATRRLVDTWRKALAKASLVVATLISFQILLVSQIASAQQLKTASPVLFKADNLRHDRVLGVIVATGHVEFSQQDRTLIADTVTYNQRSDTVVATGNVSLLESTGDVMFADYIELSGNMKDGIASGIRLRLSDNTRIAAVGGRRIGGRRTEMRKAVYSPCKPCRKDPSRAPLWQIKAYQVTRDLDAMEVEFKDAFLEFYGIPVAYIPYLSAPDPSVKRKTGFLVPSYGSDSELGTIVRVPYYIAISPHQDATVTPIYTGNEGPVLLAQYRNRFVGGEFVGEGSVTRGSTVEGKQRFRGHFDGGAKFDINDTWRGGIKATFASDDTYLRRYDFGGDTVLTSRAYIEGFRGRNYAAANAYYFQDLRSDVDQDTVPIAIPMIDYNFVGQPGSMGGIWSLDANLLALTRSNGTDSRRLSLVTGWRLPHTSRTGELYTLYGSLQTDAYWVNKTQDPDNDTETLSGLTGRIFPQIGLDWRFPLVRRSKNSAMVIEPIAGVIASPNGGNPDKIPNEDSLDFELDDTNIFEGNRFTGVDRVEGGNRVYYGLQGSWHRSESGYATAFIGQSYQFRTNSLFAEGSGLENQFSDLVGRVELVPQKYFKMLYRFRMDNESLNPRRNEIIASAGQPLLKLGTRYLFIEGQEASDAFPDREEISLTATSQITNRWSLHASTLRDLETGKDRSHVFGVTFNDSCLIFNASFTRSFTQDRDIKATDTIFFNITLKNLGSVGRSFEDFI